MDALSACEAPLESFLHANGLMHFGERALWTALTGGVSSEIWRVDLPGRSLCVKRALRKLKVAADWEAPLSRNTYEWRWLCFAAGQGHAAPRPISHDEHAGLFAMEFLAPEGHPVWKDQLMGGIVIPETAARVGAALVRLHSASADRPDVAADFDSLDNSGR